MNFNRFLTGFEVCLFVLEGTILLITVGFCHATKDVPGALNEATNNLRGMYALPTPSSFPFFLPFLFPSILPSFTLFTMLDL